MRANTQLRLLFRSATAELFAISAYIPDHATVGDLAKALSAADGDGDAERVGDPGLFVTSADTGQRLALSPDAGAATKFLRSGDEVEIWKLATRAAEAATEREPCEVPHSRVIVGDFHNRSVELPTRKQAADPPQFPWLMVALPAVFGLVMFVVTDSALSLLFLCMAPIMALGSWAERRRQHRRQTQQLQVEHETAVAEVVREISEMKTQYRNYLAALAPDHTRVLSALRQRSALLWSQRAEFSHRCGALIGNGEVAAPITVKTPPNPSKQDTQLAKSAQRVSRGAIMWDPPATPHFGIVGSSASTSALTHHLLAQLAVLYRPDSLRFVVFGSAEPTGAVLDLRWLCWLPHVDADTLPEQEHGLPAAFEPERWPLLLRRLETELHKREQVRNRGGHDEPQRHILCIVDGTGDMNLDALQRLAARVREHAISFLWRVEHEQHLPAACDTWVAMNPEDTALHSLSGGSHRCRELELPEFLEPKQVLQLARVLAGLRTRPEQTHTEHQLPSFVSLETLLPHRESGHIIGTWRAQSATHPEAATALGLHASGDLTVNLVADGPHAVVCGTTGSGKSEFLQSWLIALAAQYPPQQLQFLLVDYKGGAAFTQLAQLPHTAGLVTNLDPRMTERFMVSLRAEMRVREELFAKFGVGSLPQMCAASPSQAPARLLVVIDEFSHLVEQHPEFLHTLVDVAQRGRSLGIHLVLSAQQPGAIRSPGLNANVTLRIALRTATEAHSLDVIGDTVAARFAPENPGRAALRRANGALTVAQTAFMGRQVFKTRVRISPLLSPTATAPQNKPSLERTADSWVEAICAAARDSGFPKAKQIWVDPLPEQLTLRAADTRSGNRLQLGLVDIPEKQQQRTLEFDLSRHAHAAVVGGSGSGKTQTLTTFITGFLQQGNTAVHLVSSQPERFFGLGAAHRFVSHTDIGDREEVFRLRRTLQRVLSRRDRSQRTVICIDNYPKLKDRLDPQNQFIWERLIDQVLHEDTRSGINLIVTGDSERTLGMSFLERFTWRLRLGSQRGNEPAIPGRGWIEPEGCAAQIAVADQPTLAPNELAQDGAGSAAFAADREPGVLDLETGGVVPLPKHGLIVLLHTDHDTGSFTAQLLCEQHRREHTAVREAQISHLAGTGALQNCVETAEQQADRLTLAVLTSAPKLWELLPVVPAHSWVLLLEASSSQQSELNVSQDVQNTFRMSPQRGYLRRGDTVTAVEIVASPWQRARTDTQQVAA